MTFQLGRLATTPDCGPRCVDFIIADGEIQHASSFWLLLAFKRAGDRAMPLVVNSPGGLIVGSIELGRMARRLGLPVIVARAEKQECVAADEAPCERRSIDVYRLTADAAICLSGCAFVFAGGKERHVPDGAVVGVHKWSPDPATLARFDDRTREQAEEMAAEMTRGAIKRYLTEMSVDGRLLDVIESTPAADMHLLTRDELKSFGLLPGEEVKPPLTIN